MSALVNQAGFVAAIALRRPFQCLVQVTNRCNMRCSFCDFWPNGVPAAQELSVDDYRRLASEMAAIGRFLVSIEGGEPFVRRDLVDIVRAFAARHVPLLYTNGWYVDEPSAAALFEAGLTQVGVSIDYPDTRHDAKRGSIGAFERAVGAVKLLRDAAPRGGKQVHVMTVLTRDNQEALEPLLEMSAALGVGHCVTLLSDKGFRRGHGKDVLPEPGIGRRLSALWQRHRHLRAFEDYLRGIDPFLEGGAMPRCRAGAQSFNVDHVGNVAPCIEKIDQPVGNVREAPLAALLERTRALESVAHCQDCWTLCRGFGQALGEGGSAASWRDLAVRMRSA